VIHCPIRESHGVVSLGVNGLQREADHSSPSNAEIKNGGAIPSLPPYVSVWRDE
jgi:hypothetical protein